MCDVAMKASVISSGGPINDVVLRTPVKRSEVAPYGRRTGSERVVCSADDVLASFREEFYRQAAAARAASRSDVGHPSGLDIQDRASVPTAGGEEETGDGEASVSSSVSMPEGMGCCTPRNSRTRVDAPPDIQAEHMQAKRRAMRRKLPLLRRAKRKLSFGDEVEQPSALMVASFFDGFQASKMDIGVLG